MVVTAYGQTRNKRELAYQAPVVKGDEIAQTRRENFINSLAGRVPGLTVTSTSGLPGASAQIILRGGASIAGNNQPLFVVDGVPFSSDTNAQGNFVDGNAMLVNENRNHSDWAKYIKKLVENPNLVKDMGERLYETVKDTYDLNNVTRDRAEFYKSLIK